MNTLRTPRRWLRWRARTLLAQALIASMSLQLISAALPPAPPSSPIAASAASAETLASPQYVSAAVMPNGQVGLIYTNGTTEVRFSRYTSEHAVAASVQLSTAAPWYPQIATFKGRLVAAYVDTRSPNAGKLILRASDDNGATWSPETYPFGTQAFSSDALAPRLVASRDAQTLHVFQAVSGAAPQYRSTTDSMLATWSAAAAAGDATMRVVSGNNCGNSGAECYRAHAYSVMETATAGTWIYISKSDAGWGQSGRGTQVGTLGGSWSAQVDHGGSGGLSGCCGESTATTFLDRSGNVYFMRAGSFGEFLYFKKSTDGGYTWSAPVQAYAPNVASYVTAAPVGAYVAGYTFGEYVWYAGFGGTENTLRAVPLWSAAKPYARTGTVRLLGSAGSDLDPGSDYPYNFGKEVRAVGAGTYTTRATDLALPGRVLPLAFARTYTSSDTGATGVLGPGWSHNFEWSLTENDTLVTLRRGDGSRVKFTRNSDQSYSREPGVFDTLTRNTDGTFTLTARDQTKYEFEGGWLTTIHEPAGNRITLASVDSQRNWSVSPPLGASAARSCDAHYSSFGCEKIADGSRGDTGGSDDDKYVASSAGERQATIQWSGASDPVMKRVRTVTVRYRWSQNATIRCGGAPGASSGTVLATDPVTQVGGTYRTWTVSVDTAACSGAYDSIGFVATGFTYTVEVVELEVYGSAPGRVGTITDTAGRQISLSYDGSERLIALTDNSGRKWRYEYDASGRLSGVWDAVGSAQAAAYASAVTADAPAGYWRAEETAGTALADERGVQGGTVGGGAARGASGIAGSSTTAYAGTGHASIPSNAAFNFGTGAYTIEAWVYRTGPGTHTWPVIVSKRPWQVALEPGWAITSVGSDPTKIALHVNNFDFGDAAMQTASGVLTANAWHHLALVYTPSDLKGRLYVDGSLVLTTPATDGTTGASSSAAISLGRNNGGCCDYFQGRIDEVAIYPTALSAGRIQAHYAAGAVTASWRYGYDGTSRWLATITDPDARTVVSNQYDSLGRLWKQTDGASKTTTFTYGSGQTFVLDPRGNTTTLSYDPRNRVIETSALVSAQTVRELREYDSCGNTKALIDRSGNRTDLTYDTACKGNLLTRTDPQIDPQTPRYTTTFEYDAKNNLTRMVDARGLESTHTYHAISNVRLSTSRQVDATTYATTKWEYGDAANPGLPTKVISPRGNLTGTPDHAFASTLAYDAQGNLTSSTDPDGNRTTHGYDSLGRRTTTVDPDGNATGAVPSEHTWATAYDAHDRVTSQTDPLGRSTLFGYDKAGNRTSVTDRNGNVTTYVYDLAARLWKTQQKPDPVGQPALTYTTALERDDSGNVTKVTQANGAVTDHGYDALSRLTSVTTHPAAGVNKTTTYALDGNGNVLTRTTPDGVATSYTYDALSRLKTVAATGLLTITYGYDQTSNRTSMADGTGTSSYAYDGLGRLTEAVQPNGTTSYGYDRDSNRTSLTYPGPATVTYSYSNAGRLTSLSDWAARSTTYTYTPAGLAKTATLPASLGGLATTYAYDRAQRLTSLTNRIGTTDITTHTYTLDNEGNRTALGEFVSGITPAGQSESFGMSYDGLLRLTGVSATNPETFALDGASNLTSRSGPGATFTYDTANRLTSDGTRTYTWSDADRLTARGSDTFSYDPLDRLTGSTVSGTGRTYAYNGDGLLQGRTQGSTTAFLWDPATSPNRLLMQGGDKIVYGLGPLYAVKADGTTVTFARDGMKSVRAELDPAGAVTKSFRYTAYGDLQAASPTSATPSFLGYNSQLRDGSGLIYLRARWYEPVTGRFITRDPLLGDASSPATLNAFGYGGGNPMTMSDPSGLAFESDDEGPQREGPLDPGGDCAKCGGMYPGGGAGGGGASPWVDAEQRVASLIGVARNIGTGQVRVPGSGPGGYRKPDFDPARTVDLRGSVVEVKAWDGRLHMTPQLRDLVHEAQSRGAVLEIFSNAKRPQRGELANLIQRGRVIVQDLP